MVTTPQLAIRTEPPTLLAAVASQSSSSATIRALAVVLVTGLTAAAAQVSMVVPFTAVPFTLTPLVVLLGGAALGPRLGALSQVLYIVLGSAGLPVFAPSPLLPQGAGRLLGPTGGYLLAYPVAAFVTGSLATRGFDRRYFTSVLAMAGGLLVIFAGGVSWLAFLQPTPLGLDAALRTGFYPFVVADIFKLCVASALLPAFWWLTGMRANGQ